MADTPRFNKYIKDFGYKLRDPVTKEDGLADGTLFGLDGKIEYLNRGYASLKRKLGSILLKPEKVFPDYYTSVEKIIDNTTGTLLSDVVQSLSKVFSGEYLFEPKDIYAHLYVTDPLPSAPASLNDGPEGSGSSTQALQIGEIDPVNFFGTKFGANADYTPNDDTATYFYSVLNGNLVFAAGKVVKVFKLEMFVINFTKEFSSGGDYDLYLPRTYNDLFLTIAAYEAMIDKGDQQSIQKASLYAGYITNELNLVGLRERKRKEQEIDRTN